jgi:hypothetical protein
MIRDVTLLEQQELLEPPPLRRLIVPNGHGAWWGVDPSTVRTAVASVSRDSTGNVTRRAWTCPYPVLEDAARLSAIYAMTRDWVRRLAPPGPFRPGVVFVEQPSGKHDSPNLSYAVGVILAAVFDGLQDATGRPVAVQTVSSARWKKVACGRGNIYKPKRGEEYGVLTWARANGYAGRSWDEADAWGLAECARRTILLDER